MVLSHEVEAPDDGTAGSVAHVPAVVDGNVVTVAIDDIVAVDVDVATSEVQCSCSCFPGTQVAGKSIYLLNC